MEADSSTRFALIHDLQSKMGFLRRTNQLARTLSIDVALAALAAGVLAERVIGVYPRAVFLALLPLCVWTVYTLDHLLDAGRLGGRALTVRHRFHHRHAKPLWALCVCAAAASVILAFAYLSWAGVVFGVCVGCAVLLHEAMVKWAGGRTSPLLLKEVGVCVIFTAGTWGLPVVRSHLSGRPIQLWQWILLLQYLLLVLANLIAFSWMELRIDEQHGQTSFARGIGGHAARLVAIAAIGLQIPLAAAAFFLHRHPLLFRVQPIYAGMALVLLAILLFPSRFEPHERYRAVGDGAFIAPLLLLAIR